MAHPSSPITALELKLHAKRQAMKIVNTQLNNCKSTQRVKVQTSHLDYRTVPPASVTQCT